MSKDIISEDPRLPRDHGELCASSDAVTQRQISDEHLSSEKRFRPDTSTERVLELRTLLGMNSFELSDGDIADLRAILGKLLEERLHV